MSWLYSRALVEAFSAATCSDGARSALSSGSPTPQAFLPSDKMTAFSRPSRFGMTFKPLMDDLGAELLTWFLAGFPVRTSASQAGAQASAANDPGCGPTWRGSLARFDPDSSSWRTVQPSLLGGLDEYSVTWPRSGMTADGQCWELPMLARPTKETGYGLWVPTPIATEWKDGCGKLGNRTPEKAAKAGLKLTEFAKLWPTPTVCGNYNRKGASVTSGDGLATAVKKFPTPTAGADCLGAWGGSNARTQMKKLVSESELYGPLNPTWVEWLMGWPLGWTDLKPLETGRFHSAQLQRGAC